MEKTFAEKMLDSMVDEDGHCGDRALSGKQFWILADRLCKHEPEVVGCWSGHYKTIDFTSTDYEGNIGRYHVVINEFFHFNPRYTVVSIDLRDEEEYKAELEEAERIRQLRDFSKSDWQLVPKKRADFSLVLVSDYEYTGTSYTYYDDGTRHIYTFRDGGGNCYVWKTANPLGTWVEGEDGHEDWVEAKVGGRVALKATVKEHSEYKGVRQTVLTRAKVIAIG